MTHSLLLLVIDALAVFRLTRLVIDDAITAPARDALIGHAYGESRDLGGHRPTVAARPKVAELLSCAWCISFWVAIAVVALQAIWPVGCFYFTVVLAFSAVTGLIAERS